MKKPLLTGRFKAPGSHDQFQTNCSVCGEGVWRSKSVVMKEVENGEDQSRQLMTEAGVEELGYELAPVCNQCGYLVWATVESIRKQNGMTSEQIADLLRAEPDNKPINPHNKT